jgi:regulatory protein
MADKAAPPPDETALHEAALAYLARYAATSASLIRVLDRKVDRWARAARQEDERDIGAARQAVRAVVARLVQAGVVNDEAFAESRARSLMRAGRSRRAVAAHLAARGVDAETAARMLSDDPQTELAAALSFARRRRIGPFRRAEAEPDPEQRRRELGVLARAGFAQDVASRALGMEPDAAENLVNRLRQS